MPLLQHEAVLDRICIIGMRADTPEGGDLFALRLGQFPGFTRLAEWQAGDVEVHCPHAGGQFRRTGSAFSRGEALGLVFAPLAVQRGEKMLGKLRRHVIAQVEIGRSIALLEERKS